MRGAMVVCFDVDDADAGDGDDDYPSADGDGVLDVVLLEPFASAQTRYARTRNVDLSTDEAVRCVLQTFVTPDNRAADELRHLGCSILYLCREYTACSEAVQVRTLLAQAVVLCL